MFVRRLLILICIFLLVTGGFAMWLYSTLHAPVDHNSATKYVVIEKGMTANRIVDILVGEDIIKSPLAIKIYLRFIEKNTNLEAGDYMFPSPVTPLEVINLLQDGKLRTKTLTIPEGWTRFEIAPHIHEEFPVEPPVTVEEVFAMMDNVSLIEDVDSQAQNLEGYLYPTTYEFELGTHPKAAISKMVEQFRSVWRPEWDDQAHKLGLSRREIVVIASLIEKESKIDSERPLVSSVIYNRLKQGIPLGMDATNVYIAKLLGKWDGIMHKSDLEIDHPYNTRKLTGLPPGPIGSPGKSALEAALSPAETDYLYYVLNVEAEDGSHHFYSAASDFLKGKAAYQRWLSGQRGN